MMTGFFLFAFTPWQWLLFTALLLFIIGGTLGQFGTHTPFIVAAILSFINFIFGYYFFPESLKANNRRKFDRKRANPFGSLKHLQKFPLIKTLVLSMIFVSIANHSMESVWAFFTIEKFKWSTSLVGYSLAFIGILPSYRDWETVIAENKIEKT